jgi:hypothetical protein
MEKIKKQLKFSQTIPISVLKLKKTVKGGDENKEPKLSEI